MKVLLIQLPVPNNALSNLPLALGYLKASADAAALPALQIELMERTPQDRGGDAFLLDAILACDPDLIGFSLYTWNSTRAISLAQAIKAAAPEILLLGGGPEVNQDNRFIMDEAAFDFLIFGEGERTFVELCRSLTTSQIPLFQIAGLGFRNQKAWILNPPRTAIEDVNLVPSAYLSGVLENHVSRFMSIELSRWCPSHCTFCYYGRQDLPRGGKRYFDITRIKAELEFGLARGVEQFHFVEANFNTLPHLSQIFETIHQTGANTHAHFYAEMRGEAIDAAEAERLQAAGFDTVEVGLQSAVPEVLARVRRKNNLPRLIRGVHLLRERGIEVFLDAILGLPSETKATFEQTLDFIDQHELAPFDLFHLQILAGTQLKAEALNGQHGLIWQKEPPYFVLQTDQLSFTDLSDLRRLCLERKGDDPAQIAGLPAPDHFALTLPLDVDTAMATETSPSTPIQRVLIDLDKLAAYSGYDAEGVSRWSAKNLARRLASEVTVVLQMHAVTLDHLQMAQSFLTELSQPNPNGVWHVFVETERVLSQPERALLLKAIQHQPGYLDRLAVFSLGETNPIRFKQWPTLNLYNVVPASVIGKHSDIGAGLVAWLELDPTAGVEQMRYAIERVISFCEADLLLDFGLTSNLPKIQAVLDAIDFGKREVWFKDWHIAEGLARSQNPTTPLEFPLTYDAYNHQNYQVLPQKLDKAALNWVLAQRHAKKVEV